MYNIVIIIHCSPFTKYDLHVLLLNINVGGDGDIVEIDYEIPTTEPADLDDDSIKHIIVIIVPSLFALLMSGCFGCYIMGGLVLWLIGIQSFLLRATSCNYIPYNLCIFIVNRDKLCGWRSTHSPYVVTVVKEPGMTALYTPK